MNNLTSFPVSQNTSKINKTSISIKPISKTINQQEIISLQKLLKSEVREAKGKPLVNTYIKLMERQYETLIEKSINKSDLIRAHRNNRIFKRVLEKTKDKIKQRNKTSKSKKDSFNNTRTLSVTNNKISTNKSSLNVSPIKRNKSKKNDNKLIEDEIENNIQSTYWQDYEFLKAPDPIKNKKKIKNKNLKGSKSLNKKMTNTTTKSKDNFNKTNQLENYYLYLLNRRQKICESEETNEDRQQEKIEVEILRQIISKIYNEDEELKKNLEDKNLPEFYKRFIIQNEIRKDNIFLKKFKLNYNESQKMKGPQLCDSSRLICRNRINYEPIHKRLDKILKKKKNNLEKLKKLLDKNIIKNNNKKNSGKNDKLNNTTRDWLKSMDNWYKEKNKKIKEIKERLEKNNPIKKECIFKPNINDNAKIKKEDEGLLCSDRLYLEYFTLRDKKNYMIEKEKNNFSFHPQITSYKKRKSFPFDESGFN